MSSSLSSGRVSPKATAGAAALTLGALGVVFGDIGTSPLYAFQTVFQADHHAVKPNDTDVFGVISLVFWSITMIVSVKFVTFIMRADNDGEGGIMALIALIQGASLGNRFVKAGLIGAGLFGVALFYGDGMITPAISVMSAVEGVEVAAPSLSDYVLPMTIGVLVILFAAGDVMTVLFGSEYTRGSTALFILTIGQFINIATGATGTILIMTGRQTAWFRLSMLILAINLALNLTLIPIWGMNGAAVATSVTVGGLFALGLVVVHRIHHIWPYDRRYLKGVLAAAVTAALLVGVRLLQLESTLNLLVTTLVAGVGFYGLLLLLGLDTEDRTFVESILRRVRAK